MPRQVRIQYPGAMYHVISRGNRRQDIFLDDVDRQDFLKTLAEACQKTGWQVRAYCLMSNHYHLVVAPPSLVAGMEWGRLQQPLPRAASCAEPSLEMRIQNGSVKIGRASCRERV